MKNLRKYKDRSYQYINFNKSTPQGKICNFLEESKEKVFTINNLRNSVNRVITRQKFIEGLRVLDSNRVIKIIESEKLFMLWGESTVLIDAVDRIYLESIRYKSPRQNIIVNSFPFVKIKMKHLDRNNEKRYNFNFWDMYLDVLNQKNI